VTLKLIKHDNYRLSDDEQEVINHWVIRNGREQCTGQEKQQTEAWLKEQPERQQDVDSLDAILNSDAFAGALRRYDEEIGISFGQNYRSPAPWYVAIACAVVIGFTTLLYFASPSQPLQFQTSKGQLAHQSLQDGSALDISADSQLLVKYSAAERHIDLVRGEALFNVSKDPSRPFIVQTRHASLKALGTVFNVDQRRNITELTVLEGRVEITPAQASERQLVLTAGQSVRILPQGSGDISNFSPAAYASWQDGILQARHMPLQELIDELNRYRTRPLKMGAGLDSVLVTGRFRLEDEKTNLQILSRLYGLSAEDKGNTVIVTR